MVNKLITTLIMLFILFVLTGTASATISLTTGPVPVSVPIGGYNYIPLFLQSDDSSVIGWLTWHVSDPGVIVSINDGSPGSYSKDGITTNMIGVMAPSYGFGPQQQTMHVITESGVVSGKTYNIDVKFCTTQACTPTSTIEATTRATVVPTPELSTSILSAAGLIGMLGLVKFSRKN